MAQMNLGDFARELSEEYDFRVEAAGRLSSHAEDSHKRRIRAMLDKVEVEYIPDEETVRDVQINFGPWNRPKVTVWCRNDGFDYENSQVYDARFMVNGHLHRFKVDVRPF